MFFEVLASVCFEVGRKGVELSSELKNVAVCMFNDGLSIAEISRRLQRSYSTVSSNLGKLDLMKIYTEVVDHNK
jgi:DNA-binding transcriptional regulator LsrR (DeoR family)